MQSSNTIVGLVLFLAAASAAPAPQYRMDPNRDDGFLQQLPGGQVQVAEYPELQPITPSFEGNVYENVSFPLTSIAVACILTTGRRLSTPSPSTSSMMAPSLSKK